MISVAMDTDNKYGVYSVVLFTFISKVIYSSVCIGSKSWFQEPNVRSQSGTIRHASSPLWGHNATFCFAI